MSVMWQGPVLASLAGGSKIQRRLLAHVLPLVIVPLIVVGIILWWVIGKTTRAESSMFLNEREQDLLTLCESTALANYTLYTEFELKEEAELYRLEFEAYLKQFMARRNHPGEPIYEELAFVDQVGMERIKITQSPQKPALHDVRNSPYFQAAQRQGLNFQSPIQPRMTFSRTIYGDGGLQPASRPNLLRGVIVAHFDFPLRRFRAQQITGAVLPPIAMIISMVVAVCVITALVRKIVHPLRQLVDAAESIAAGDLRVKIEANTGDEVEQLARSFNYMASSLEDHIQRTIASERKYHDLFIHSKDGIFICDMRGHVLDINQAGLEILGYRSKEDFRYLDNGGDLYFRPPDWQLFETTTRLRGFVKDFEVHLKRQDAIELDVLITGSTRLDPNGSIIGYEGIIRDITEKKRLERELIQSHKMAAISKLVAGVSHELNTPLAAILSNLRVCTHYHEQMAKLVAALDELDGSGSREGIKTLSRIQALLESVLILLGETRDAGQKAGSIIDSLRRIYHPGAGSDTVAAIDLNEELNSVLKLYRQAKNKISFQCHFSPLQPVTCYNNELAQVFINIINNGIHAMEDAGEITIQTGQEGHYARVSITDHGKGIPPEVLPKIFDPFYTTKSVGKGMGIGLSIVWAIIEKHEGRIHVNSELDRGTTFTIDLPLAS